MIICVFCASCGYQAEEVRQELEDMVNAHLKPGDPDEKIIRFFESNEWRFSYEDVSNAYYASDPSRNDNWTAYQIIVHLRPNRSFDHVQVNIWHASMP